MDYANSRDEDIDMLRDYILATVPASDYQPSDPGELQRLRELVEAKQRMIEVLDNRIKREQVSPRVRLIAEIAEGRVTHGNYSTYADAVYDAARIVAETEKYVRENP